MKKTSIIITLIILTATGVLTYISNIPEKNISDISPITSTTTNLIVASTSDEKINQSSEVNPSVMSLGMKTWTWVGTIYNDGKIIKPKQTDKFKLTLKDKTFSASTDCNGVGGEYITKGQSITFDKMMSTLMYCEDSQETDFSKSLTQVSGYRFTSRGELVFDLKYDSGVMMFK